MLNECFSAYEAGGYSPKLLSPDELEPGTIVVSEEDDNKRLEFARMQVLGTGKKVEVSVYLFTAKTRTVFGLILLGDLTQ